MQAWREGKTLETRPSSLHEIGLIQLSKANVAYTPPRHPTFIGRRTGLNPPRWQLIDPSLMSYIHRADFKLAAARIDDPAAKPNTVFSYSCSSSLPNSPDLPHFSPPLECSINKIKREQLPTTYKKEKHHKTKIKLKGRKDKEWSILFKPSIPINANSSAPYQRDENIYKDMCNPDSQTPTNTTMCVSNYNTRRQLTYPFQQLAILKKRRLKLLKTKKKNRLQVILLSIFHIHMRVRDDMI